MSARSTNTVALRKIAIPLEYNIESCGCRDFQVEDTTNDWSAERIAEYTVEKKV
jgi:hypothetical protein